MAQVIENSETCIYPLQLVGKIYRQDVGFFPTVITLSEKIIGHATFKNNILTHKKVEHTCLNFLYSLLLFFYRNTGLFELHEKPIHMFDTIIFVQILVSYSFDYVDSPKCLRLAT
jgi:hypothetical protein